MKLRSRFFGWDHRERVGDRRNRSQPLGRFWVDTSAVVAVRRKWVFAVVLCGYDLSLRGGDGFDRIDAQGWNGQLSSSNVWI